MVIIYRQLTRLAIPANAEPLALTPGGTHITEIPRNFSAELIAASEGSGPLKTHAGVHPDSIFVPVLPGKQSDALSSKSHTPSVLYTINEVTVEPSPLPNLSVPSPPLVQSSQLESEPTSPQAEQVDQNTTAPSSFSPPRVEPTDNAPATSFFDASVTHRYETSFSQFAACSNNFFALGDTTGHVGMWVVRPESFSPWCGKLYPILLSNIFHSTP